jgi:rhamnosyl/mannosyltransferase
MGGIENFMAALMRQQAKEGNYVSALVHHHNKKLKFSQEVDDNVKVYRTPSLANVAYSPISPSFVYHLNEVIKKEQPDIIHIHMPNLSAFWCLFLHSARKIPWVIHWHADVIGSVPDIKIKLLYPFYRLFELALIKKAQSIVVTSPVYLASSSPLKRFKQKAKVIPLGLPLSEVPLSSKKEKGNFISLLMIGRLTYYKGHNLIIDAIAKLKEQNIRFSLKIVGGGELFSDIEKHIKIMGLSEDVLLLGKLSDAQLEKELLDTDLLCLPSIERTEAFGVVLLEAMRVKKPCLVSDVPGSGMSWVVQDNETGFVVQHNNTDAIVKKLKFINDNRKLLTKYEEAGHKRFNEKFEISAISQKMSSLYRFTLHKP